jgi:hypothetical protein
MYRDNDNPFKAQEFVAHSTEVNCLSFGPKSHQILATGGKDAKVNVWRAGDAVNIWTLGQNKTPVECLCFDAEEQYVVSGAMNGSIKVFDLNEGRLARNLSGHQVNACSIQYHPYGEFIVSGSSDCSMKVWDVRNKSCIQTYSGHKKGVTCVRFSPDGRWIASSGKDNQLLIWDLVAGKLLNTIRMDPAYVTSFEFNPAEFVIAAVTSTRNVRFWDMETMEPLSNTPSESSAIRAMTFSGDGNTIYTATKDSFKHYGWEPTVKLKGSVQTAWDNVAEIRISSDGSTLTAGSFNSNFVSIWSIDLDKANNPNNVSAAADSKRLVQQQQQQKKQKSKAVSNNYSENKFPGESERVTGRTNSNGSDLDYQADAKSFETLSIASTVSYTSNTDINGISSKDRHQSVNEISPEMHWESEGARNEMERSMSASFQRRLQESQRLIDRELSLQAKDTGSSDTNADSYSPEVLESLLPASRYIVRVTIRVRSRVYVAVVQGACLSSNIIVNKKDKLEAN